MVRAAAAANAARGLRALEAPSTALAAIRDVPTNERVQEERSRMAAEIDTCTVEAQRRRTSRAARAPSLSLDDLLDIEEQYRIPEERALIAELEAARAALIRKRQADPKWLGVALSAVICRATDEKADLAKEIRAENNYARQYGGVVDKGKIYDLQLQIRERDEEIAELRGRLRKTRAAQIGCGAPLVRKVATCLPREGSVSDAPDCASAVVRDHVELAIAPVVIEAP